MNHLRLVLRKPSPTIYSVECAMNVLGPARRSVYVSLTLDAMQAEAGVAPEPDLLRI